MSNNLAEEIKQQGEVVRKLKAAKEPADKVTHNHVNVEYFSESNFLEQSPEIEVRMFQTVNKKNKEKNNKNVSKS